MSKRRMDVKIKKYSEEATSIKVPRINRSSLPEDFFDLIPQRAVKATYFPEDVAHNSIWDMAFGPDGRIFVSLCGEGSQSVCAQLHEYLRDEDRFRFCFDTRRECMVYGRSTPPSKIHSSMCLMNDGRLIIATHTPAPAPKHPFWLMEGFYSHQWEGYQGANILIYDPATGDVRNLGCPVPRDSIYGAAYDPKHNAIILEIKQTLRLADFLGYNSNAVRWQIWIGLLVHLILRYLAHLSSWAHSFTRLFTVLRAVLWRYLYLDDLLNSYGTARPPGRICASPELAYLPGFR